MGMFDDFLSNFLSDSKLEEYAKASVGTQTFQGAIPSLLNLRDVLIAAGTVERFVSSNTRRTVNQEIGDLSNRLVEVMNFDASRISDPGPRLTAMSNAIITSSETIQNALLPAISMSSKDKDTYLALENKLAAIEIVQDQSIQINSEMLALKQELDERLMQERLTSTEVGTSQASLYFQSRADAHAETAKKFGIAALGVTAFVVLWVFLPFGHPLNIHWQSTSVAESIIQGIPHFTILALGTFAIGLLLRNYRVNQHLSVLNRTKATTLHAGESFVKSVRDTSTRDIILETVVRSVFALGETGYLQGDQERQMNESPNLSSLIHAIGLSSLPK